MRPAGVEPEPRQAFDPDVCELCGSRAFDTIFRTGTGRVLRSDRTLVPGNLEKRLCRACRLVRCGSPCDPLRQERMYRDDYRGGAPRRHAFYTDAGPVPRSDVFADWFSSIANDVFARATDGLECGAGSGELIAALAGRFPQLRVSALEMSVAGTGLARATGLRVVSNLSACADESFDVIWAVAVLEHVAAPTAFLRRLRRLLRRGGHLLLAQPTQDVKSLDILFVDHLFHFGTAHLRRYASRCGFRELRCVVGHPLMPTYSLHLWRATDRASGEPMTSISPTASAAIECVSRDLLRDFAELDAQLDVCVRSDRRIAVFGLGETFWMLRAYTTLFDAPVVCGAVDEPDRDEYRAFEFPVTTPEHLPAFGVDVVFLTMSPEYQDRAAARISKLGLTPIPVVSSFRRAAADSSIEQHGGRPLLLQVSCQMTGWLNQVLSALERDGCAVVTDVVSPAQLEATRSAMYRARDAIAAAVGAERLEHSGELGVLRLMPKFDAHFFSLLELPPMLAVVDATVSSTATLHLQNGLLLPPQPDAPAGRGAFQFGFHRDFPRILNGYLMSINCLLAIDPFTTTNGATRVVPGSHQRTDPVDQADLARRALPVVCPAGSMIVFDSTLWHAAGENRSNADRLAINHQFTRSYVKQQIDYVRALGDAVILALPLRTQQLLGWYTRVVTSLDEYYRPESERLYRTGQG